MLAIAELRSIDATRIGSPLRGALLDAAPGADAAVLCAPVVGEAIALGAFQRVRSTLDTTRLEGSGTTLVRRRSGGPAIRVGRGHVYFALELRAPELLGGVRDPDRALNRHVRPLLAALTSLGDIAATSGGRDLILARGVPVAWVGVAHHRATRRTSIEAVIDVKKSFAIDPAIDLAHGAIAPRWNGATPTTLDEVLRRDVAPEEVVEAILRALSGMDDAKRFTPPRLPASRVDPDERPFTAMVEESIGLLGAVREANSITIGGDLMASEDRLAELGRALFRGEDPAVAIDAAFDEESLLFGVRDRGSIVKLARAVQNDEARGS